MKLPAIVIQAIRPTAPNGATPKAVVGVPTPVRAEAFRDGHDLLAGRVKWRRAGARKWHLRPLDGRGDQWEAEMSFDGIGAHQFVIEMWTDRFATWRRDTRLKVGAGQDVSVELTEGALLLESIAAQLSTAGRKRIDAAIATLHSATCSVDVKLNAALDDALVPITNGIVVSDDLTASPPQDLWVDRRLGAAGAWYEFFPRSEGGFGGATHRLRAVADMGFDVVYFPPIHPIGTTARKGPNNTLQTQPGDPGSPWAIGSREGGHDAIHPDLGSFDEFAQLVATAQGLELEVALDFALQCSPDHPWVTEHPEWFHHRPDGSIKYAENPPKKYQDIYPINFWPDDDGARVALWDACRDLLRFWIERGISIFRVDNPHTKPVAFWEWCIAEIRGTNPEVVFLAEAFTTPTMMAKLAEIGFTQSYTYFTWRTEAHEIREYVEELSGGPLADYMRPSFWPNTPDILAGPLRGGNRAAFQIRYLLAATLVSIHGVYSGYELLENQPASDANEEYLSSEKYECKTRDWSDPASIAPFMTTVNLAKRAHPSFDDLRSVKFHHSDNANVLAYTRGHLDSGDLVLVVVTLDPDSVAETTVRLDLDPVGLDHLPYTVTDALSGETYEWHGSANYVRLDPASGQVGHLFAVNDTTVPR